MDESKRDKTKVDPVTGAEEQEPTPPLQTVPQGQQASATSAEVPGSGEVVKGTDGEEARRIVRT